MVPSIKFSKMKKFEKNDRRNLKIFDFFKVENFSPVRGSAISTPINLRRDRPRTDSPAIIQHKVGLKFSVQTCAENFRNEPREARAQSRASSCERPNARLKRARSYAVTRSFRKREAKPLAGPGRF